MKLKLSLMALIMGVLTVSLWWFFREPPMTVSRFDELWNHAEWADEATTNHFLSTIHLKNFPPRVSDLWQRVAYFGGEGGEIKLGGDVFHRTRAMPKFKTSTRAPKNTTVMVYEMLIRLDSGEYRRLPPLSIELERR
mgnify:CR=1 FL=1